METKTVLMSRSRFETLLNSTAPTIRHNLCENFSSEVGWETCEKVTCDLTLEGKLFHESQPIPAIEQPPEPVMIEDIDR